MDDHRSVSLTGVMSLAGETSFGTEAVNFVTDPNFITDPPFDFEDTWRPSAKLLPPQIHEEGQQVENTLAEPNNRTNVDQPNSVAGLEERDGDHPNAALQGRAGGPLNLSSQLNREGQTEAMNPTPVPGTQMTLWKVNDTGRQGPGTELFQLATDYFSCGARGSGSQHRAESIERQMLQNDTDVKINFELGTSQVANFKAFLPATIAISVDRIHPYCRSLTHESYEANLDEVAVYYHRVWRLNLAQKAGLHIAVGVAEAFIDTNCSSLKVRAWDRLHMPIDPRIADSASGAFHEGVREILRDYDAAVRIASFLTGATIARSFMSMYRDAQGLPPLTLDQQFIRPEMSPQQEADLSILGQAVLRCIMVTKGSIDFLSKQPKNKGYHNEPRLRGSSNPFITVYNR